MAGARLTVGNVEMVSVSDGQGDMNPTEAFPASAMEIWQPEQD